MRYGDAQGFPQNSGSSRPARPVRFDPRRSRQRMVREQILARGIEDPLVIQAMSSVPRHLFVAEALAASAYDDVSLPIGYGQTISQPYMVARIMSFLEIKKGMRVLEIGSGSGYQAALLAAMGCAVFAVERIEALCRASANRLRAMGLGVAFYNRDGTNGLPHRAPFDRVIVSAGGPLIPQPLVDQLKDSGRMIIPVGQARRAQRLTLVSKLNGLVFHKDLGPAVFVDLIGAHGWNER